MITAILDQNGIKDLRKNDNIEIFIASPMLFWELFNNLDNSLGPRLIGYLRLVADRIRVTYKSITCENIELDSKSQKRLFDFVDQDNTKIIYEWLISDNAQLSEIKNKLASEFSKESFNKSFYDLADKSWIPKLKSQYKEFESPKEREAFRNHFDNIDDLVTEDLFKLTLSVCFELLKKLGYTTEQSVRFIKNPSVFYNRVFCHSAILRYRSTQTSFNVKTLPNDSKDIDYLFCSHLVDEVFGGDLFMNAVFSHLKKSYKILESTETGLDQ